MSLTIQVTGYVMTSRRIHIPERLLQLPSDRGPNGEPMLLRELIARIVLEEVEAFRQRQEERRLFRMLTEAEILREAERGKVDPGGREGQQEVDPQEAVRLALQAFEDRLYYVFIDGVQLQSLDQPVRVKSGSRVLFVRLVPLAGG